ncbi:fatty acid synthase-like [Athalia rosae]|uniref:fatty acid synthase-like n=1 Tax=Athalia rosae TaxID=37344 RepID=UPI0020332E01|nr:fatty acid synthase-like [Athalia rosae]
MLKKNKTVCKRTELPFPEPGDEVVISGIAGRFPESNNVKELEGNLFSKKDLITDDGRRWKLDHPDIPQRTGKVYDVDKFDNKFFKISAEEANCMDPVARILLEHTYEALIDAGVNPRKLRGTRTGVYLGTCYSETEKILLYADQPKGYGAMGCSRFMMANRISQWLDITGPSYATDTACSSSLYVLDHAFRAIRSGECEAAIVGGANLCLHPYVSMQFYLLGVLAADGSCKSFDNSGNGYCRSEAISVVYLQKAKDAKRIHARIVYTKTNCDGFKEEGITFPSNIVQRQLLQEFYEECQIPPSSIAYVEAHGTGTKVGDPVEVDAIDQVFSPGRTKPLRIGSIKSNLGHSEPASGLCSIAKIIIAMETGYIPPNIHYKTPRKGIKALEDGRIQVITEPTPWEGGLVGINSFGFGGANAHVLLEWNSKEKTDDNERLVGLPRLVVLSGRTEEAVTILLDDLESRPLDVEYVGLFHNIHSEEIEGHFYRGYTIFPPRETPMKNIRHVQHFSGSKRSVCFVFSGLGSQWPGMGKALLRIPVFAKTIKECDATLRPYGVDVLGILTAEDPKLLENIMNTFIGITAMQIGLIDVLASLGIVPDNVIGHSIGELGCAYAVGDLTAKQTILIAYFQGLASIQVQTIRGSMATVECSSTDLKILCPSDIEIACYNGPRTSTISGPADSLKKVISKLQEMKIPVKMIACANIAYHTRHMTTLGKTLYPHLGKIIRNPKPRSQKWLSTSVPQSNWTSGTAKLCSAEYFVNNLISPVLFEQACYLIPANAITIEVAPHGILQSVLKTSLSKSSINIDLMDRNHRDHVTGLLQSIGKMYEAGLHPKLTNLYDDVQYPVSRETPMISPLLRWNHSESWQVISYRTMQKIETGERIVKISVENESFEWISGHVVDGRNLVPATGYLDLIWETLGMMQGEIYTELSVMFEDVRFHRAATVPKTGKVILTIMVHKGSGRFEVNEGGTAIVTGFAQIVSNPAKECIADEMLGDGHEELGMTSRDVYKELRLRGYQYTGLFRAIQGASVDGTRGRIAWEKKWAPFMDNMLQMKILGIDTRGLFVPTGIQKLVIDTEKHSRYLRTMTEGMKVIPVEVHTDLDVIKAGGVEIRGLKASAIPRKKPTSEPVLEDFKFVTHRDRNEIDLRVAIRIAMHLALENHLGVTIKTIELLHDNDKMSTERLMSPTIQQILANLPLLQADIKIFANANELSRQDLPATIHVSDLNKLAGESDALLGVGNGLLSSKNHAALKQLLTTIMDRGFVILREPIGASGDIWSSMKSECLDIVMEKRTKEELVLLLRKQERSPRRIANIVKVSNNEFTWVSTLQALLKAECGKESRHRDRILLVSEGDLESGLMGLVNCLRREPGGDTIQALLIQDLQAPKFSLENPFYTNQLDLGLALNVLRPGKRWGSYRFFAMNALPVRPVHHARINQQTRGDLNSLKWVEGIIQPESKSRDIVKIYYSSINFRDVMLGTGKLAVEVAAKTRQAQESVIGFEYSGIDADGRAVMGMIETGAMANLCVCDRELLWTVPDGWSLEDAATVPAVYGTAYYALVMSGKMKKGDKVLIHAGSGGVGQAAIRLALHVGCEVFTTVGTPEKRAFIRSQFPQISDDHIGNSRDSSFEQLILQKTDGRGVDIVLNSLAEEKLQASVRCLTTGGRFLEIGKFDLAANNPLGMEAFVKGISFHGILLDNLFTGRAESRSKLSAMLAEGIRNGAVKPLVRTVFPMDQAEAAFRYMAAGKHIGKVIVKIRDEDEPALSPARPLALPRFYCSEEGSHLILGGLGGFGLELADWLVLRGAKKLVFTSRKGISNGYQQMRINIWRGYGVKVSVVSGQDPSTREGCEAILKEAIALGPVEAIFNLAVVLKDNFFENQTVEAFEESFGVKARATKHLDKLSRTLCPHLRQFVVFSSVSCGRGNAGQTNYGMSNSVMEKICEARVADKLPGLAVQWGAIGDVGLVAEMQEDHQEIVIGGTLTQPIISCLQELDGFLQQKSPVVSSMVVAEKVVGGAGALNIVDTVLNIMGLKNLTTISAHSPLAELGMDSMMAVEIKQTLEREFDVFLTPQDIRTLNFQKLDELSTKNSNDAISESVTNGDKEWDGMKLLDGTMGTALDTYDACMPLKTPAEGGRTEVFMIPGIEAYHTVFDPLVGKLKSPTTCLQLGLSAEHQSSVSDMAEYFISHINSRNEDHKNFVIVGYSFGSLIAVELARRFESEGRSGRLVLIDGSPDLVKSLAAQNFNETSDEEFQTQVILEFTNHIAPTAAKKVFAELQNRYTWEERVETFLNGLSAHMSSKLTPEFLRLMCLCLYNRLRAIGKYKPSAFPPLKAPIILIKPKRATVRSISEDYGLGSLTQGNIRIRYADGNHLTVLNDEICAAAINGELEEDDIIRDPSKP